jgi:FkbM family methyltransferase
MHKDQYWRAVADFVLRLSGRNAVIVCPSLLVEDIPGSVAIDSWTGSRVPDVVVLHKGELNRLDSPQFIGDLLSPDLIPGFANEVFVVFVRPGMAPTIPESSIHLLAFRRAVEKLRAVKSVDTAKTRSSIYLGNNRALTTTVDGHKIFVDTRDISLAPHILLDGYWELWITQALRREITPGSFFIDIGANVGYFTVLAADWVGPAGRVLAFEPLRELAELVHSSLSVNGFLGRAKIEPLAVTSCSGESTLYRWKRHLAGSSLVDGSQLAASFLDEVESISIRTVSLDEYLPSGTVVDVIKIDAEGAEAGILKGAERVIVESPEIRIVMEFSPVLLRSAGADPDDLIAFMRRLGFRMFRIMPDSSIELAQGPLPDGQHWDILFKR